MLDGVPTTNFKQYRHILSEEDVEVSEREVTSEFHIHHIKLSRPIEVSIEAKESKMLKVSSTVTSESDKNDHFILRVNYDCTPTLTGVSDVYFTFNLDGNVCTSAIMGVRKKCGSMYAYAPVEIAEVGWFSNTILTSNGGQTVNTQNIFDDTGIENVVVHKEVNSLTFKVRNMKLPTDSFDGEIDMLPPLVRPVNDGQNAVYPVLRGAGARRHTLKPGQYTEFKLEFNCISMSKEDEAVEVIFRPAYHTAYIFKVTKE